MTRCVDECAMPISTGASARPSGSKAGLWAGTVRGARLTGVPPSWRDTGNTRVNTLLACMTEVIDGTGLKTGLTQLLRERRKLTTDIKDNFNVLDTKQLADTLPGATNVMAILRGAVAAVSLLRGGIGIMNIMLVTGSSTVLAGVIDVSYLFSPGANLSSFLFPSGVSVLVGYFPAGRAVRLDLIEALRHE